MTELLHYHQQGQGEHIILIHGLLGSSENLNMVAKGLNKHFTVTSVDVRNHGNSFHHPSMDYPTLAQDLLNLMEHLAIKSTNLLGHSMGGKIAMAVALCAPEKINKLIVADISPVKYPPHHNHILKGLQAINLANVKNRNDADQQLAPFVDDAGVRQFLLRNLTKIDGHYAFKCNLTNIENGYEQIMLGHQGDAVFTGDTLFIKGANSDYILPTHRGTIMSLFPNSSAKVIQGAGHWLHAEKTIAFNKIVIDFLAKE